MDETTILILLICAILVSSIAAEGFALWRDSKQGLRVDGRPKDEDDGPEQ